MAINTDITTTVGQMRFLIGDIDPLKPSYQDADLQGFINMAPGNSLYLACSFAMEGLANKTSAKLNNITLGSLKIDQTSKVAALREAADRFKTLEYDTPAFAVAEENLSSFNELRIIRNWILRTEF